MPAHIPFKYQILMLLGGLVFAAGVVFLLSTLMSGPKLGPHYDFLLNLKNSHVVSREILIIETDEYVEGNDIFRVFMTLTEMNAANLVMTGKVSPSSSPIMLTENEIRRRFFDEYSLVGGNIRGLFEGIRMGFVSPLQAPLFVERVVELSEQGRDRLISALIDRDEDLIRSASVFGNYFEVDTDILTDWDGKVRRVKLADTGFEHPVYQNLKNRYDVSQIETVKDGRIFWFRGFDGRELDIPLDKDGNIITPWNCNIRRIDISLFRDYDDADYSMRNILIQAGELGIVFDDLLFLAEYSFVLRDELLQSPSDDNRITWRNARTDYFKSLDTFFNNPAYMNPVMQYESMIADTDPSNDEEIKNLIQKRDELKDTLNLMYEEYANFSFLHSKLDDELLISYCIMGPPDKALYSSLVANATITGSHIKYAHDRYILIWAFLASFVVLIIIFLLRPFFLLIAGILLSFLTALIFALILFFGSYWIDPIIVFGSSLAGTLLIFYCKCALLKYRAKSFRAAYGAIVSKSFLQSLIIRGKPGLSDVNVVYAAIIAIKETNLLGKEDREKVQDAGKVRSAFLSSVKKVIFNAGAVIVGFEGDTILACFGSPLEPHPSLTTCKLSDDGVIKSFSPIDKACALIKGLMELENNSWRFGIDAGDCTFYWSPETGYSVNGRPAVRARILVSKTTRFKARALITDTIRKKTNMDGVPLGTLYDKSDTFFAMK